MLYTCYRIENKKIKSSLIWVLFFLIPIFPTIFGTMNYMSNLSVLKNGWFSLWTQHTLFYGDFFFAPLMAIYASYLFRLEHCNHNWNSFFTSPVAIKDLFFAKALLLIQMSFLTQIWMLILFYISGRSAGLPVMPSPIFLLWLFQGFLGGIPVILIQLYLSMKIKSFSVPILIALAGSILSLPFSNTKFGFFWPYALPMLGMNANLSSHFSMIKTASFCLSLLLFSFLFSFLAIHDLKTKDIIA